jgi:hypothetical protein
MDFNSSIEQSDIGLSKEDLIAVIQESYDGILVTDRESNVILVRFMP